MLTDQEKEDVRHARERATAALQGGDLNTFDTIRLTTVRALQDRLEEIRQQSILADDETPFREAARFVLEQSYAWSRQRRDHFGPEVRGTSQPIGGGPLYPLPVILATIAHGEVASVEVTDGGFYQPLGGESQRTQEALEVRMRLRPEAEEAEFARRGHRPQGIYCIGLMRTPTEEPINETARRLSREPTSPTREEVNGLLHAIEAYNATHEQLIAVTITG